VAAGAGACVAKHGNRSVSSKSGSADVLEALGISIAVPPEVMKRCLDEVGICFLFAPALHKAMKHAIGPRKEIAVRTIFNVLGPLTNPASAPNQLLGVFAPTLVEPLAHALGRLGSTRAYLVHGADGLDEVSLSAETHVAELRDGEVRAYTVEPEDFGFQRVEPKALEGGTPRENAATLRAVLDGEKGPSRDVIVLNAGFALAASGNASTPAEGIEQAGRAIDSGAAARKLEELARTTTAG
jgi:anthranilate phosphoribosyltransferase